MMLAHEAVKAAALLGSGDRPHGEMVQNVLLRRFGTTEFGFRHARRLKSRLRNVPPKIATHVPSRTSTRGRTRPRASTAAKNFYCRPPGHGTFCGGAEGKPLTGLPWFPG